MAREGTMDKPILNVSRSMLNLDPGSEGRSVFMILACLMMSDRTIESCLGRCIYGLLA